MISHVHIGIADFERAFAFWRPLMEGLGHRIRFHDAARGWAGFQPAEAARPLLLIGRPYDGQPAHPGNGQMVALLAPTRTAVDVAHATAMAQGGTCEGRPGLRPDYHSNYYGAYFRDPDGNKICICCHHEA